MAGQADFPGLPAVMEVVAELADAFVAAGHRLYLVGGVVRDLALGSHSALHDIDLTTDAEPAVIKSLVKPRATAVWSQGERFGTIGATINGRDLEITTHRAEAYDHTSRKPVVAFGTSIDDDLVRRDFTINAMAVSLPDLRLVDPFGGIDDLVTRRLITPLSPEESFADDPLRMLRAARFLPRFDLDIDPTVEAAASRLASRMAIVSVERVQGELERLLALPDPADGFHFLRRTGLLGQVVAPYADTADTADTANTANNTAGRAVRLAATAATPVARRAGLFLPLGPAAGDELRRLRYSRAVTKEAVELIEAHPVAVSPQPTPADVRAVVAKIGLDAIPDLRALTDATHPDSADSVQSATPLAFWLLYREVAATEDLSDLGPTLSGRRIMDHLGLSSGPEVGLAARHLRAIRIERGPLSDSEALAALDAWALDQSARQEAGGPKG